MSVCVCGQTGIISGEDDKYERLVEGCNAQVLDFPGPKSLLRLGGPGGGGGVTHLHGILLASSCPACLLFRPPVYGSRKWSQFFSQVMTTVLGSFWCRQKDTGQDIERPSP